MVNVSSQDNQINITVSSGGNTSKVNVTPDMAAYYSDKSREWATSNKIVDGVDYSSKYYANASSKNATNAKEYKEQAQEILETTQIISDGAIDSINATTTSAVTEINSTKAGALENINTAKDEALEEIASAGIADAANKDLSNLTETGENKFVKTDDLVEIDLNTKANTDLSNLTDTGEKHFLGKSQITNCLLEVPQNIKLELNNGTLTLKAGSKVIVPNGINTFSEVEIENDKGITQTTDGIYLIGATKEGNSIFTRDVNRVESGSTRTLNTTYSLWYDTTNNIVLNYGSSATTGTSCALPVARVTVANGAISSIDQVFNGFGYIGSTVWVNKGVKGLIPNEKNDKDGSLINTEWEYTSLYLRDLSSSEDNVYKFGLNGSSSSVISAYSYDEIKNINLNGTSRWDYTYAFDLTKSNGVITSFKAKQPFRVVDYSDITYAKETYRNGASWYRVYSDGFIEQGGQTGAFNGTTPKTITYLKQFSNTNYNLQFSIVSSRLAGSYLGFTCIRSFTNTSFTCYNEGGPNAFWYACGY